MLRYSHTQSDLFRPHFPPKNSNCIKKNNKKKKKVKILSGLLLNELCLCDRHQFSCSSKDLDKPEEVEPEKEDEEQVLMIRPQWHADDVIDRCDSESILASRMILMT